jgi:hypothetical protein
MRVHGIDFTSRPTRRKPITGVSGTFDGHVLHLDSAQAWANFPGFENALAQPGPWIAGLDFPFGQARRFVAGIGWPLDWAAYVRQVSTMDRATFRVALDDYRRARPPGDKEHRRRTDKATGAISPQKLYGTPVGLMFYEGAPRLLRAGVTVVHLADGDPERIAVEAYPGVLARQLIGRRSYKHDSRERQTADQRQARATLLRALLDESFRHRYGISLSLDPGLPIDAIVDEPGGDRLDALLCAVQAAWAWQRREQRYGAPGDVDPVEGWISAPLGSA